MPSKRRAPPRATDQRILVLRQFRVIFGAVRQHFREVEIRCGVSGSQLWILQEVSKTPGIGVTELARRLSIHQTTCTQLLEKLVRRRLIKKEGVSGDRRRVGLFISALGQRRVNCAPGPSQGVLPEALAALPASALKSLEQNLAKVIVELDIKDANDSQRPLSEL